MKKLVQSVLLVFFLPCMLLADDTAALQEHLSSKNPAVVAKGVYTISDTLTLTQSYGYALRGAGGQIRNEQQAANPKCQATVIKWAGPAGKPMLEVQGCTGLVIEGVNFVAGSASQGILIRDAGGSLNIALRDFGIIGGDVGIQCGINQGESTCANITYDNIHWQEQREACVRMMNLQSLEHLFLRPKFALAPIAIDVVNGGDVSVFGGGSYEIGIFLKLGNGGRNCRGFDITSARFDGKNTRTAWVTFADPTRTRTYGPITFSNCSQNNGQRVSDFPLITAGAGSRVIVRDSSFDGGYDNWARVHSDRFAGGEFIVQNCDGLEGDKLDTYVQTKGDRAYYEFTHCGTIYGPVGSVSTFPDTISSDLQFTEDEINTLKQLIGIEPKINDSIKATDRIKAGELETVLPEE